MGKAIKPLLLMGLMLVFGTAAWGQYYQYTDENGVLRYTDNLAAVPPDQRENVTTHESIVSAPVEKSSGAAASKASGFPQPADEDADKPTAPAGSWKESVAKRKKAAEELDRMQADLNQTFMALQNEKSALADQEPPSGATEQVKQNYRMKVEALNRKIEGYENQLKAFREKEAAFMAMGRE